MLRATSGVECATIDGDNVLGDVRTVGGVAVGAINGERCGGALSMGWRRGESLRVSGQQQRDGGESA